MILSIHQPAYIPWLPYLKRIEAADAFVFLDHVQFEKNSFINRNRIKLANGEAHWLTVPVLINNQEQKGISNLTIDHTKNWAKKHFETIKLNYKGVPEFELKISKLRQFYEKPELNFSNYSYEYLNFWLRQFGIKTKVIRSSQMNLECKKMELVLEICAKLGVSRYISGPQGKNYLSEAAFKKLGIELSYHSNEKVIYQQLHGTFLPHLSVLDFWMNSEVLPQ